MKYVLVERIGSAYQYSLYENLQESPKISPKFDISNDEDFLLLKRSLRQLSEQEVLVSHPASNNQFKNVMHR